MQSRDDDIISNPSEEERGGYLGLDLRYPPSGSSGSRPLPLIPGHHSRGPSSQSEIHSIHDPARAHSRVPSSTGEAPQQMPKPNLNPKAKPFIFGARAGSGSGFSFSGVAPSTTSISHSRLPSSSNSVGVSTRLNAAAAEFRPGGFSFKAPPFPTPTVAITSPPEFPTPNPPFPVPQHQTEGRPLPFPPTGTFGSASGMGSIGAAEDRGGVGFVDDGSPFKVQGREKRQRRDSGSDAEFIEGDSMASFRFPSNFGSPASLRMGAPSPRRNKHGHGASSLASGGKISGSLNPTAEPFTFAGFSNAVGILPHIGGRTDEEIKDVGDSDEDKENNANLGVEDVFALPASRTKRAPIPLDFKHPVSTNTVPAGLFKALANHSSSNSTDERTRPTVRSRLSSREYRSREFGREVDRERDREFYELGHDLRASLDDLGADMPAISHKVSRTRLVTDPGRFLPSTVSPTVSVHLFIFSNLI